MIKVRFNLMWDEYMILSESECICRYRQLIGFGIFGFTFYNTSWEKQTFAASIIMQKRICNLDRWEDRQFCWSYGLRFYKSALVCLVVWTTNTRYKSLELVTSAWPVGNHVQSSHSCQWIKDRRSRIIPFQPKKRKKRINFSCFSFCSSLYEISDCLSCISCLIEKTTSKIYGSIIYAKCIICNADRHGGPQRMTGRQQA